MSIAGKTSVGAFGALARRALAFRRHHDRSMHVAAAVGAPTVGIFPFQTDFPERWAPLGERSGDRACLVSVSPGRYEGALSRLRLHRESRRAAHSRRGCDAWYRG